MKALNQKIFPKAKTQRVHEHILQTMSNSTNHMLRSMSHENTSIARML